MGGGGACRRAHPRSVPTSKVEPQGLPLRFMDPPRPGAEVLRPGRCCAVLGGAARRRPVAVFGGLRSFVVRGYLRLTRTLRAFVVRQTRLTRTLRSFVVRSPLKKLLTRTRRLFVVRISAKSKTQRWRLEVWGVIRHRSRHTKPSLKTEPALSLFDTIEVLKREPLSTAPRRESEPPPRKSGGRAPHRRECGGTTERRSRCQERQRGTAGSGAVSAARRRPPPERKRLRQRLHAESASR